jgi:hypothetical protein
VANADVERIAADVSERVREALADAERRAGEIVAGAEERAREIVSEAEADAERIRSGAERQARERVARARAVLEELGTALGEDEPEPEAATPPEPAELPEPAEPPEPPAPEDAPTEAIPQPVVAESREGPSTDELIAQLKAGATDVPPAAPRDVAADDGGEAAARLVAMNMALDGASREEVDRHLAEGFAVGNRGALIDEVFARVGK